MEELKESISKPEIARIYSIWNRVPYADKKPLW